MARYNKNGIPYNRKTTNLTFSIDKNLHQQFKTAAEKDCRKMSQVINQAIVKYLEKINKGASTIENLF